MFLVLLTTFSDWALAITSNAVPTLHFDQIMPLPSNTQAGALSTEWAPLFTSDSVLTWKTCHAYPVVDSAGYYGPKMN